MRRKHAKPVNRRSLWAGLALWVPAITFMVALAVFPRVARAVQTPLSVVVVLALAVEVLVLSTSLTWGRRTNERRLREEIAQEILAQKQDCPDHPYPSEQPASCWVCARAGAFQRSALIASGKFGLIFPHSEDETISSP